MSKGKKKGEKKGEVKKGGHAGGKRGRERRKMKTGGKKGEKQKEGGSKERKTYAKSLENCQRFSFETPVINKNIYKYLPASLTGFKGILSLRKLKYIEFIKH